MINSDWKRWRKFHFMGVTLNGWTGWDSANNAEHSPTVAPPGWLWGNLDPDSPWRLMRLAD